MKKKEVSTIPKGYDRLERHIAHLGLASRREAKSLILEGKILVNNKKVINPGFAVHPEKDKIKISGIEEKESLILYKPRGIETNSTSEKSKDIKSSFPKLAHLSPIGRLDKESEGMIILSNDGTLTKALTQKEHIVEKEYLVTVRENIFPGILKKMEQGIIIDKIKTLPAKTKMISKNSFNITLIEGRKHQIRRMCAACKLTIESLVRIRIGHLNIGKMKPGNVKPLKQEDILRLKSK